MKRALTLWSIAILTLCGILALASEGETAPVIDNIRLGEHQSGHTRIVFDMDSAPQFSSLPGDGAAPQLEIVIANSRFAKDASLNPRPVGVVKAIGTRDSGIVISLEEPALPLRSFVIEPNDTIDYYRLVFDLEPVAAKEFAEAVTDAESNATNIAASQSDEPKTIADLVPQEPEKAPAKNIADVIQENRPEPEKAETPVVAQIPPIKRVPRLRPDRKGEELLAGDSTIIVIDPGHGGKDPGAIGGTGLEEKRVTWSVAKSLEKELVSRGYTVILTRNGDVFVPLKERLEIARDRQADMFISIHADANHVTSVRGASVYTLSEDRSNQMTEEVGNSGNFTLFDREMSNEDRDVSSILFDLANTDTMNQSERLATALIRHMSGRMKMVNNTHRHAGLVVLLSPDVPAVLVELAFMSNPQDEANLGSRTWRNNAAAAIADGIDGYFATGRRAGVLDIELGQ